MELWNQNGLSSAVTFVQHCQIIAVSLWPRPEFETPRLFMRERESVSVSDRRNINFEWTMDPASRNVNDMYDFTARHLSKEYLQYILSGL